MGSVNNAILGDFSFHPVTREGVEYEPECWSHLIDFGVSAGN